MIRNDEKVVHLLFVISRPHFFSIQHCCCKNMYDIISSTRIKCSDKAIQSPLLKCFCWGFGNQDQDQDSLLVKRRNDNHSPGPVIRKLVPTLTREVNLATQSSASSADEIRESGRAFQFLIVWGKKLPL